jgi:hypothetical protein
VQEVGQLKQQQEMNQQRQMQEMNQSRQMMMSRPPAPTIVLLPPSPKPNFARKRKHEEQTISHLLDDLNRSEQSSVMENHTQREK